MPARRAYPTDLSDVEWRILEPFVPDAKPGGRPRPHEARELLDAVFYVVRGGCAWRLLPHEFPPWKTVYHYYFRAWRLDGTWRRLHDALRQRLRRRSGREATPSAAIIDSRTARTTERGGPRGYDGGKKMSDRKRHLLVDTAGLVVAVAVHEASVADRDGARLLLGKVGEGLPRLELQRGVEGVDEGAVGVDARDRQAAEALGEGAGGRGATAVPEGLHHAAEEVGGGEDVGVDQSQPQDEPRLRVPARDDRDAHLRVHDPADAQEVGERGRLRPSQTPSIP